MTDPIIPDPEWDRISPNISDDDIYEDDDFEFDDDFDDDFDMD